MFPLEVIRPTQNSISKLSRLVTKSIVLSTNSTVKNRPHNTKQKTAIGPLKLALSSILFQWLERRPTLIQHRVLKI